MRHTNDDEMIRNLHFRAVLRLIRINVWNFETVCFSNSNDD